jgi:hypothetical protein
MYLEAVLIDDAVASVRLDVGALASILPALWIGSEVAKLDEDPCRPLGPVVIHPRQLEHEESPVHLPTLGTVDPVREDELVIEVNHCRGPVAPSRDELDDATVISAAPARGGQPVRFEPEGAVDEDLVTDCGLSLTHVSILANERPPAPVFVNVS